ncbi:hypothetical protein [Runella slithyformis]|uniref:DUF3108 domain-containing protein n=1 Tax=Runella slithyformis (strain ATCC 29530 / DSM 19594 / LMG 11500 / NCIMB 11436 / LSU 4) TaxID=761193 RepID=A0A7U4E740_RUNSL|nr:hypothetical protein [Runella slithyformis]AEI50261.1 hypothetical protein Runsl_3905 [Runella slithyformis DSM 19594]
MKSIFLFLLTIATFTSNAQNLLTPSKKSFDKKWVKNTNYQMTWYALRDTTKFEMGKVTTQIFTDKTNLTVITQVSMKNMKTPWVDSTVANLKTLKPIRHSSYNMQRDMVLNFGKIVTGFYNDKMKKYKVTVNDTTKVDYFDSNLYPVLIGWLPLHNDYKQDISIYDYNPSAKIGVIKAFVKNVSSSTCQTDKNGIRPVWVVTVSDEIGNGENGVSTYYFDKEDRKLWKQEIDANGRKMMMKLVE